MKRTILSFVHVIAHRFFSLCALAKLSRAPKHESCTLPEQSWHERPFGMNFLTKNAPKLSRNFKALFHGAHKDPAKFPPNFLACIACKQPRNFTDSSLWGCTVTMQHGGCCLRFGTLTLQLRAELLMLLETHRSTESPRRLSRECSREFPEYSWSVFTSVCGQCLEPSPCSVARIIYALSLAEAVLDKLGGLLG